MDKLEVWVHQTPHNMLTVDQQKWKKKKKKGKEIKPHSNTIAI